MQINIEDIITTDKYIEIANKYSDKICHIKTDFFSIGHFNWRGSPHPNIIKENAIITHSDYPITTEISKNFKKVFCVNNLSENENTFSLPLGFPDYNDDLKILKIIGDKKNLMSVINTDYEKVNLLYLNFSVSTQRNLRQNLIQRFNNLGWSYFGNTSHTIDGFTKYLIEIKKSKFVLCPRGNGIDTHRLWESLYLGSIPIIEKFKTHDMCSDLPVLFVDDWSEINENYLNEKYLEIKSKTFNFSKLKISYWENYIKEKIYNDV
jgi:hypothetical protein